MGKKKKKKRKLTWYARAASTSACRFLDSCSSRRRSCGVIPWRWSGKTRWAPVCLVHLHTHTLSLSLSLLCCCSGDPYHGVHLAVGEGLELPLRQSLTTEEEEEEEEEEEGDKDENRWTISFLFFSFLFFFWFLFFSFPVKIQHAQGPTSSELALTAPLRMPHGSAPPLGPSSSAIAVHKMRSTTSQVGPEMVHVPSTQRTRYQQHEWHWPTLGGGGGGGMEGIDALPYVDTDLDYPGVRDAVHSA